MNPLRSVGARLSLALLIVVAGALGFVYVVVVPFLEGRLVAAKRSQLERSAPTLARQLAAHPFDPDFVENAAETANARVVVYRRLSQSPPTLSVVDDSRGGVNSADVESDPLALRASLTLEPKTGTVERGSDRYAEVAVPVSADGSVLLLSASLRDTQDTVELVRRRLLAAGAFALLIALGVGYGGAWMFARRLRRLERAAERIASGRFDEPVVDRGADEVGELGRAFERMRRRLAQLEHARREFIANASHELRTPLFTLGGFLELLDDQDLDEATRQEFLVKSRNQVERLTKLAAELLDLSRLDAGQLQVEREPFALDGVARLVVDEFGPVARSAGKPLEVIADREVSALGDEQRVLQIGRILVENALVHTPPGTRVRVRVGTADGKALLAVEDEGEGIAAEHAAHIFDRFYRVDGAQASGSGLGLAIARELAELMGGSLGLESQRGRTVFTVLLPRAAEPGGRESRESRENGGRAGP